MPRRLTYIILTVVVGALCTVFALPASADPSPTPVALTVSTPADPLPAEPGQVLRTWLRIGNNGTSPLPVTITPATVALGNNGATSLSPHVDPRFADRITLSTTTAIIAAGSFTEVQVTISVPTTLVPDTYVLGFLITPTVTGGSVQVVNQVGALITIDLPGSRDRRLEATFLDPPLFAFTSQPSLIVRVRNIGRSALEFTSETTIDGFGTAGPADIRRKPVLLPAGRYRDVEVKWDAPLGAGIYRVHTRVVYHRTQAETAEQSLTHTVVVLSPSALAVLAGLLIAIAAAVTLWLRHRRRVRQRTQRGHGRRTHRQARRPDTPAA
ncbi:MAG TPA: hypothetical protein VMZ92_09640 [Planctomycetota bacterium]|nr:hypothetical protein [Planctomycetota bacterium]